MICYKLGTFQQCATRPAVAPDFFMARGPCASAMRLQADTPRLVVLLTLYSNVLTFRQLQNLRSQSGRDTAPGFFVPANQNLLAGPAKGKAYVH